MAYSGLGLIPRPNLSLIPRPRMKPGMHGVCAGTKLALYCTQAFPHNFFRSRGKKAVREGLGTRLVLSPLANGINSAFLRL